MIFRWLRILSGRTRKSMAMLAGRPVVIDHDRKRIDVSL